MKTITRRKCKTLLPIIFYLIVLAATLPGVPAFASEAASGNEEKIRSDTEASVALYGLHELIKIAYENNPGIGAARAKWQAAVEMYPQAKSLPNPSFSMEIMRGEDKPKYKLSQMVPGFGKLVLMGKKAQKMAEMKELEYEMVVRDVITGLKVSYFELQYLQEALALTQKNKTLVEELLKIAERDYGSGKADFQSLMRAQSQLAQVTYDLLLLEELRQTEQTRVNSILNRGPETPVEVPAPASPDSTELDLDSLYALAKQNRQEILMAGVETEMNHISLGLAKRESKPDFDMALTFSGNATPDAMGAGADDNWGVMFGFTLPIWRAKNRAAAREAEFGIQASENTRQDRLNSAFSMIKNLFFKISSSRRLVDLYEKTLIPQARKSIELSETWYNSGEASFSEMLETQAVWLNFELALARARADLSQNLAELEMTVGAQPGGAEEEKQ